MSLNQLKNFRTDQYDLDDLVVLSAEGKAYQAEYKAQGVDVPEWLESNVRLIGREIGLKIADAKDKKIRQLRARINSLKTASERRADLQKELETLEGK
jgi:hypothetical protein